MADKPGWLHVTATSFETIAVDETTLRYSPPLADRSPNPDAFEFWWRLIEYRFSLPDPSSFPALGPPPAGHDLEVLLRYVHAGEEMAESTVLGGDDGVTVHIPDEGSDEEEIVDARFSSNESLRGFTVLFRQFHADDEPASFNNVQAILRRLTAASPDQHTADRFAQLDAWGRAVKMLRAQPLKVRVGEKLQQEGKWGRGELPGQAGMSPEQLISAYNYGDLIHWGDKLSVLITVAGDPFESAWQKMAFLEAATGFTHLYLGFSLLVASSAGDAARASGPGGP